MRFVPGIRSEGQGLRLCGWAVQDHPFDLTLMSCIRDYALLCGVIDPPKNSTCPVLCLSLRLPCVPTVPLPPHTLTSPFFTVMDCRRGVISSLMLDRKF